MTEEKKALDRYLSPLDVWSMAFGCMVGWGVFAMPGNTFLPVAGPAGTVIAMGIGMVIMLIIGANFSYLMGRTAITGGVYSYTKDAFGRDHAFLSSWFLCLSYLTIVFLNGTALFYVVRTLFGDSLQGSFHYTIAGNPIYPGETVLSVLVLSGVGILFIKAKAILQKLLILSIVAAAFAYAAMTLVSVATVPDGFSSWQAYISGLGSLKGVDSIPTFHAARAIMGNFGLVVMAVTAVAAILTGIIGGYRATTRVLSTMAEDRILSEKFSRTTYSILFIMIIAILLSFLGRNTLNWFVDLTSFGAIVGFGYTSAAAWKIARTEGNKRIFITGLIGTIISVVFVLVQLIPHLAAMEAMGSEAFLMLAF